jgi:hypothetical protein
MEHSEPVARSDDMAEPQEFQAWFDTVTSGADIDLDRAEGVRRWFLEFYRSQGPVSHDVTAVAWLLEQIARAEEAVLAVVGDLHRTSGRRPHIEVDDYIRWVRITVDGNYTTSSMNAFPFERSAAFAEVAEH